MKKRYLSIPLFLLCMILLFGCDSQAQPPELTPATNAEQAVQNMDLQMAAQKSYRADVTMDFVLYADQTKMRGEITGIVIEDQGEGRNDYYSYTEIRNAIYVGHSTSPKVKISTIDAYHDGFAYVSYTYNKNPRKMRCKMRPSEFLEYVQADSDAIDFSYTDCQNTTFEQTDKGYTLVCSEYSAGAIQNMIRAADISDLTDNTLQDMQVTIQLDKEYLPTKITVELLFDSEIHHYMDTPPYFRMVMQYSEYNTVERITRTIEPEDYTETRELRVLKELDSMIAQTVDKKKSGFTRTTVHTIDLGESTETVTQTDTATFSNTEEGFSFKVEIDDGEHGLKVTYANGDMIGLPGQDGSKINRMTDEEAKQVLIALINDPMLGYDQTRVTNVEKTRTGYLVTMCPADNNLVEQLGDSLRVNFDQNAETIEFVIKWGKIVAIIHSFDGSTRLAGQTMHYQASVTLEFD